MVDNAPPVGRTWFSWEIFSNWRFAAAMPTLVFLAAYLGTCVFAALYYALGQHGVDLMGSIGVFPPEEVIADIGTPGYYRLLLAPLLIVPVVAFGIVWAVRHRVAGWPIWQRPWSIHRPTLILMVLISFGYCLMRLLALDSFATALFACGSYEEKIALRMQTLNDLGLMYFIFAYGVNMVLPLAAWLVYILQGRRRIDLAIFFISMFGMIAFVVATYSKAPLLVFLIMMGGVFVISRSKLRYALLVLLSCVIPFIVVSEGIYGSRGCSPGKPVSLHLLKFGFFQRMGVSYPYYFHYYKDPETHCWPQHPRLREWAELPPRTCVMSVEMSRRMWPENKTVGFQPTPATVHAYGELGMHWAYFTMVLCGLFLGLAGVVASLSRGTLFIALSGVFAGTAYYLTQVSFIGSFIYPHGLIPFMIPVIILAAVSLCRKTTAG